MSNMFCFQCEQTAGQGCTSVGVCGKAPSTSDLQDDLTLALIRLAQSHEGDVAGERAAELMMEGLFTTVTNVNFDDASIRRLIRFIDLEIESRQDQDSGCAGCSGCQTEPGIREGNQLFKGDPDIVSLRSLLLLGLRGMAAYAYHAHTLGVDDAKVTEALFEGMRTVGTSRSVEAWLSALMQFGHDNFHCMELLDKANTQAFGHPQPTQVSMTIEKGPFIVVSGHDLHDLKLLLDQTEGKGVSVYTHGEMLPAHGYPKLKQYPHLKGNFGTAWQNQQNEFHEVPGAFLFTTNCLMPPKDSYADRVFTTAVVEYPGLVHVDEIDGHKDFSKVIEKALELGGYDQPQKKTGINGGDTLTTGFAHETVLSVADQVVEAVKNGDLRHLFLVGGCDGAKPGRNYYTDFVASTPEDSLILTLACGKYRFNDLELGKLGDLPRLLDMGQCNDAYSAIKVAVALSEVFETSINDLPLTLVLSWYEQKAVCILLTLLALGVKGIYLGPTLPAFVSENVLNVLVEKFDIRPISTPEEDLKTILG